MGRLIDADSLKEKFGACMFKGDTIRSIIDEQYSVEAIPKDQYKTDMVDMLEDIKLEIKEYCDDQYAENEYPAGYAVIDIIQQKINKLKGE